MTSLAGITEWLGLTWRGPDWTYPTGGQALAVFALFNVVSIGLTLVVARKVVRQLPPDYFVADVFDRAARSPFRWIGENTVGLIVLGLGIVFLFSPGQGMVLILLGIVLLDLPRKQRVERKLAENPKVMAALNWMRGDSEAGPLIAPPTTEQPLLTATQWAISAAVLAAAASLFFWWLYVTYQ